MSERNQAMECSFALLVTGDNLPMDSISGLLSLAPTRIAHKGELLNRLPEIRADKDEWFHVIPLTNPMRHDEALTGLLDHLKAHRDGLSEVEKQYQVTLRLSVQSDYAQMVYVLTAETLTRLQEVGLPLEVSSLSWGEVGI